jgi:hypothetical protein
VAMATALLPRDVDAADVPDGVEER